MAVLIVYSSTYGNTGTLARSLAEALAPSGPVAVRKAKDAMDALPGDVDLLFVGAPTQQRGAPARIGVREFVESLAGRGFAGTPAAAFDTRLDVPEWQSGSAARWIAGALEASGCLLVVPPEGFLVEGYRGPVFPSELLRAKSWAQHVAALAANASADRSAD